MTSDKLSDRLRGMLLETTADTNGADILHSSSSPRPLIEVVRSDEKGTERKQEGVVPLESAMKNDDNDDDDDDDAPPPIHFHGASTAKKELSRASPAKNKAQSIKQVHHPTNDAPPPPPLAEQLLVDAKMAKQKQQSQQTQREKQRAKKSTFGLKKGFLNSSNKSSKKTSRKNASARQGSGSSRSQVDGISKFDPLKGDATVGQNGDENNLIYELDNDGNMVPSLSPSSSTEVPSATASSNNKNNPLHLPEVQSAMLSHLQSQSSQWATPDLLNSISQNHPKLASGMNDPRYMKALQSMQTNPKETLERCKKESPEIMEWLMEFCGVMGAHFVRLGEEQDGGEGNKTKKGGESKVEVASLDGGGGGGSTKVREMGPLEEKALRRHHVQKQNVSESSTQRKEQADPASTQSKQHTSPTNAMDNQVASILADEELRSILLDPKMQKVMEECQNGNKLRYYMGHEEYSPKIRRLMEAGLIRFA
ncbi:hypothetical protein ACHAXR_011732 [Thalassiosira sp. AJA248-18]